MTNTSGKGKTESYFFICLSNPSSFFSNVLFQFVFLWVFETTDGQTKIMIMVMMIRPLLNYVVFVVLVVLIIFIIFVVFVVFVIFIIFVVIIIIVSAVWESMILGGPPPICVTTTS